MDLHDLLQNAQPGTDRRTIAHRSHGSGRIAAHPTAIPKAGHRPTADRPTMIRLTAVPRTDLLPRAHLLGWRPSAMRFPSTPTACAHRNDPAARLLDPVAHRGGHQRHAEPRVGFRYVPDDRPSRPNHDSEPCFQRDVRLSAPTCARRQRPNARRSDDRRHHGRSHGASPGPNSPPSDGQERWNHSDETTERMTDCPTDVQLTTLRGLRCRHAHWLRSAVHRPWPNDLNARSGNLTGDVLLA